VARRVFVTLVAGALLVAAEMFATIGAVTPGAPNASHVAVTTAPVVRAPYGGEPRRRSDATVRTQPRVSALRFVRDYIRWSAGRLKSIPAGDATRRVIRLLEQQGRNALATQPSASLVGVAVSGARRYLVTSAIGNFLVGRREGRWTVVSVPGA
jgi:hypothetical protein